MSESITTNFLSFLDTPMLSRIRRNHGLEHATLHVLARRMPGKSMGGHSDRGGFWILGDIPTAEMESAVQEALTRLQSGEHELAVHPNCGTNFATAGILAGAAASVAMIGSGRRTRDLVDRLPLAITLATLALMFASPLGSTIQAQVTTDGNPESLEVVEIIPKSRGRVKMHRVVTRG